MLKVREIYRKCGREREEGTNQEVGLSALSVTSISQLSQAEQGEEFIDSSSALISMLSQEHKRKIMEIDRIIFMTLR